MYTVRTIHLLLHRTADAATARTVRPARGPLELIRSIRLVLLLWISLSLSLSVSSTLHPLIPHAYIIICAHIYMYILYKLFYYYDWCRGHYPHLYCFKGGMSVCLRTLQCSVYNIIIILATVYTIISFYSYIWPAYYRVRPRFTTSMFYKVIIEYKVYRSHRSCFYSKTNRFPIKRFI